MGHLRARAGEERGAIFVMVAVGMVVVIGAAALAIDIGQVTSKRRDLQAVADVVALDSARALNGSTAGVLGHPATGLVTLAAQGSAQRNGFEFNKLTVELGTKSGTDPFVPAASGSVVPDAVRVTATDTVEHHFRPGTSTTDRFGVAVQSAQAGFSVGSFLVSISPGGNTMLAGIFGESFGVNVLSYDGLVATTVSLEAIGLEMPTGVLTPHELLTSQVEVADVMLASAQVLRNQGDTAGADILDAMRLSMTSAVFVNLGDMIIAESGGESAAATAELDVLGLLTGMAFIADGTHAVTIPSTTLAIPGVGDVTVALNLIEPPQTVFGPVGTTAKTAQLSATITPQLNLSTSATVNGCSLQGTLGALLNLNVSQLLTCSLGGVVNRVISLDLNASIPITLGAAGAEATLTAIDCGTPGGITVTPDPIPLELDANVDLTFSGTLLGNPLGNVLRVRANGGATSYGTAPPQDFEYDVEFGVPRTVGSTPLGLAGLTNMTASQVTLLDADLGPVLSGLTTPVLNIVNSTLGQLDGVLMGPLNDLLGLNLGGADITALERVCNGVRLAE